MGNNSKNIIWNSSQQMQKQVKSCSNDISIYLTKSDTVVPDVYLLQLITTRDKSDW